MNIPNGKFTILNFSSACGLAARIALLAALALPALPLLPAQTAGTGSVVGMVTDQDGKVLADARVEIANKATAATIQVTSSRAGWYSSGPIQPGNYVMRVQAKGFKTASLRLAVQVGNTASVNVKMQPGPKEVVVEVAAATAVNIEQAGVQSVLNGNQIEALSINGRNFLDLAQLEPGVQVQDGSVFAPGKNGLSSASLQGQFGRTTRIDLDGGDISDEMVGTTTQNIPASAIQEFQVSQSLLDFSTGLTSSGAVNVITRSGSDQIHGEIFGLFRGNQRAADLPGVTRSPFQREQFGGNAGGPIIKDKVFLFVDAERTKQDLTAAEPFTYPFDALNATLAEPYRDFDTDERVDWNMRDSTRAFYRFNYFEDSGLRPDGAASSTQQFRNTDNTATNALGVDFNTGAYAHSLRFEYLKMRSATADATSALSGMENPIPGLGINIGAATVGNCILSDGGNYCGGPSWLGSQQTIQSDKEAKYDGTRVMGKHIIRYGLTFNRIDGARLAGYSAFPQAGTTSLGISVSADPTAYPADWVSLGNAIGFSTNKSAFGFPGGGVGPDNRLELYLGDGWKIRPKLTLTYGVRYVHDTGLTDSGLGPLPDLNQWGAGLGNRVRNPNLNLAPEAGFAWDAGGNGRTVIRGGGGLFYDNSLGNNVLLDSPSRLAKGMFADSPEVCRGGVAGMFPWPVSLASGEQIAGGAARVVSTATGLEAQPTFCGGTISAVAPEILALSGAFQAAAASVTGSAPNGNFVGTTLTALNPSYDLFYPNYRTPRAWQMNLGIQKEIGPGSVLSVDYLRSVGEHFLLGQDVNHSGAARSFSQANAVAARDSAQLANGCPAGLTQATCMVGKLGQAGAQDAYSLAGLDSNLQATGGGPCPYCAFPGTNPITRNTGALGGLDMLFPEGTSLYSGVQVKLVQRIDKPMRGVKGANFQISYTLSRYVSQEQDQNSTNLATDNDDPLRFTGPNAMDRKHQVSFDATIDLPLGAKISVIGHFYSPLPQNLLLPELTNGGEIYATDWLGSGLGSGAAPEPLPGTRIGQFEHGTTIENLNKVITAYNHDYASRLTPAGECLVANAAANNDFTCPGLISGTEVMTPGDMSALGWVMPTLDSVAPNAVGIPWQKSFDLKASWPLRIKDRVTIEPSAVIFNVFNLTNEFLPGNLPGASLLPGQNGVLAPNVVGGIVPGSSLMPFRANFQSGTFALGVPRQFEFGLRVSF
ncbi:MAG: carboxypeptidase regulatory-like domain-containing protein [Candidatus Sulfotelmatobacter sp.]